MNEVADCKSPQKAGVDDADTHVGEAQGFADDRPGRPVVEPAHVDEQVEHGEAEQHAMSPAAHLRSHLFFGS